MITGPREPAKRSPVRFLGAARWSRYVPPALGVLTFIVLLAGFSWGGNDDPFITFRYAHNLRSGAGLVYNVGERILSTTAPLYAVLLAALGLIWKDLSAVSNVISLAAIVTASALLVVWAQSNGQKGAAMVAAALLALSPPLLMTAGAETALYVMLVLGAFAAHARSHLLLAAVALAIATMVRPDAVVAAIALAMYHLIRYRSVSWKAGALYFALVGLWYAGLWLYFGSPIPVTLQAKQQQGNMNISTGFAAGFVAWVRASLGHPLNWLHWVLAVVGVWSVATHARHWLPLFLWAGLYFAAYTILGVSRYFWYYAVLIPAFVVLVAEGAAAAIRLIARLSTSRTLAIGVSGLLLACLLAPVLLGTIGLAWKPDPRHGLYSEIGHWLQAHTDPDDSVGALEVGIIGYYSQRPMVGFAGLIQPDVARQLTSDDTYLSSASWAIQTYKPDYVLLQKGLAAGLSDDAWFSGTHQGVRSFTNMESQVIELFERNEGQ